MSRRLRRSLLPRQLARAWLRASMLWRQELHCRAPGGGLTAFLTTDFSAWLPTERSATICFSRRSPGPRQRPHRDVNDAHER